MLFHQLRLAQAGLGLEKHRLPPVAGKASSRMHAIVPAERVRYLADIATTVRDYHRHVADQARVARERQSLRTSKAIFERAGKPAGDFRLSDVLHLLKGKKKESR